VPHKQRSKLRTVLSPAIHYLYRGAAGFIGYSSHAASVYKRYGKPTFVAPNSFLPAPNEAQLASRRASIASRASVAGRLQVLTIGTLKAQKRYAVLLQAVAKSRIDFHLHVVGDGPERPQLERMAADLGIAGRVTFHGALYSAEEKASLLQAADVGVIPGRGGLAIQEMMAYGVPVISGVADGTERDLVADGRSGYLVDGFPSVDDISRRLTHFSSLSGDARHAMSLAALDVVVHESNTELMAQRMAAAAAQVRTR
jgi:glycosyltransferase involved in cell wall biosynthesis